MAAAVASPGGNSFAEMPNDLASVERMCEQLYTAQDSTTRKHAESVLLPLSSSTRHLTKCLMILDNSSVRSSPRLPSSPSLPLYVRLLCITHSY